MGDQTESAGDSRSRPSSWARQIEPLEWALLAVLVLIPAAWTWHFASPSFFFHDDVFNLYTAHQGDFSLSFVFGSAIGHLAPGYRLAYLAIDRLAPMDFDLALAFLILCQAASAVLLQRIFRLVFGAAWWTYALAFAWAISIVYLPAFLFFAAGILSITTITATMASFHGYLCWRASGRRGWLYWSLAAMAIGLAFYTRALLIPVYLVLMRVLLLDPDTSLRASIRSVLEEWRTWAAYAGVGAAYLVIYAIGDYQDAVEAGGLTADAIGTYLRIFWINGFWPITFGVRVPQFEQGWGYDLAFVGAQLLLAALVVTSVIRRRSAWRAWAFLFVVVLGNALMVLTRVSQFGPEAIGYYVRYYTEPFLLVPIALAFAFAAPKLRARVAPVEGANPPPAPDRLPKLRPLGAAVAAAVLASYMALTLSSADVMSEPFGVREESSEIDNGRVARDYVAALREELERNDGAGARLNVVNHEVPLWIADALPIEGSGAGHAYKRLSAYVPLLGDGTFSFNEAGPIHIVSEEGRLVPTRFDLIAGGPVEVLQKEGRLGFSAERARRTERAICVTSGDEGGFVEWIPNEQLPGDRNLYLRAEYGTSPPQPVGISSDIGGGFKEEPAGLPATRNGFAFADLGELGAEGAAYNGVRLNAPPGQLCLRRLEIGVFDPPPPLRQPLDP